ncbi:NADH:flavin oxidoreductase/NADH oxidase [Pholiota conissans]|uniref:NADH:flavin oxidoreductase/NADH oxidase n=1 Tax=Pholiota conissans TaxID=109636 RepID=A0A9P5ZBJ5_9AGAR|nr:NADH:flavin oxidoreductase/NADH oxidase [Pholiota conissans]
MDALKLYTPTQVGDIALSHRVVMAPLTRLRADDNHVPRENIVAEYYSQRASVPGTLIITEATLIAQKAGGYDNVPGIWNADQIAAWKKVTEAVHAKGSYIFLQLWAVGRGAMLEVLERELGQSFTGEASPYVSSSNIPLLTREATAPAPRQLTIPEIAEYVELYAQAADNAVNQAGFDGVEVHGANGYLIDQFLQDVANKRTDKYGGSIENRTQFALEVLNAVTKRVGPKKTGFRISPWNPYQGMGMADPVPQFSYLVKQILQKHPDLAYLHVTAKRLDKVTEGEVPGVNDTFDAGGSENDFIREIWSKNGKKLITAGGYTKKTGERVAEEKGDLIAYGRPFISNPDLPYRLKHGLPLQKGDRDLYYAPTSDPKGYTDYPFSPEFVAEAKGI